MTRIGDIVPPYIRQRIAVVRVFEREIAEAQAAGDDYAAAQLLRLRGEVLAVLDPIHEDGDNSGI